MSSLVSSVVSRFPGRLDRKTIGGLIEDPLILHGRTFNKTRVTISGRPIHTGLNMNDIAAYIAEEVANEAELLADSKETMGAEALADVLKRIDQIDKAINGIVGVASDNYVFGDKVVVQVGHTGYLRDYGAMEADSSEIHVDGYIEEFAGGITVQGKKLQVFFFDPFNFDEKEMKVCSLEEDAKHAVATLMNESMRLTSSLKLSHEKKKLEKDVQVLNGIVGKFRGIMGDQKDQILDLQKRVGEATESTWSRMFLAVIGSQLGFAIPLLLLGVGIALFMPPICTQTQILNATLGTEKCVERSLNPFSWLLPVIFTLGGVLLGPVAGMRFFKGKT